jgi:adenine-specific DNA-methyltransferase
MPTLDFKGKQHIYAHHLAVPYRPLVPDESKSIPASVSAGKTNVLSNRESIGHRTSDIGHRTSDIGHRTSDIGHDVSHETITEVNPDDNLIIHGDNLHALKALLPRYAGRIKCIYIDPPYNTGNEGWVYNDGHRTSDIGHRTSDMMFRTKP